MKKLLLIILCFPLVFSGQNSCNYKTHRSTAEEICKSLTGKSMNFSSNIEAELILEKILSTLRIPKDFALVECSEIENCMALVSEGTKYILYNKNFIKEIGNLNIQDDKYHSSAKISVLAHEIGHHVYGHTSTQKKLTLEERRKMELEADEFSGFVMYKIGATLDQAKILVDKITSNFDDTFSTHPSKNKMLEAIEIGYKKDMGRFDVDLNTKVLKVEDLSHNDYLNFSWNGIYKGKPYTGYFYDNNYHSLKELQDKGRRLGTFFSKTHKYYQKGSLLRQRNYYYEKDENLKYFEDIIYNDESKNVIKYNSKAVKSQEYILIPEKGYLFINKQNRLVVNEDSSYNYNPWIYDKEYYEYCKDGTISCKKYFENGKLNGWSTIYSCSYGDSFKTISSNRYYIDNNYCHNCINYKIEDDINKLNTNLKKFVDFYTPNLQGKELIKVFEESFIARPDFEYAILMQQNNFKGTDFNNGKKIRNKIFWKNFQSLKDEVFVFVDGEYINGDNYDAIINYSNKSLDYLSADCKKGDNDLYSLYEEILRYRGLAKKELGLEYCSDLRKACIIGNKRYSDYEEILCEYHKLCLY